MLEVKWDQSRAHIYTVSPKRQCTPKSTSRTGNWSPEFVPSKADALRKEIHPTLFNIYHNHCYIKSQHRPFWKRSSFLKLGEGLWGMLDWKTCDGEEGTWGKKNEGVSKGRSKACWSERKKIRRFLHQVSNIPRVSPVGSCSINKT